MGIFPFNLENCLLCLRPAHACNFAMWVGAPPRAIAAPRRVSQATAARAS